MLKIVIQDDEGKVTQVPLIRDEITVGRKEGNTIRLTERNVSREHARILRNNGTIAVEDLNSYNGVRVNGSRIQGRVGINVSDRIQIGDYLIELKAEAAAAVPGEAFGDETQPIETAAMIAAHQNASASMNSIPAIAGGEDDATTKMTAPATAMLPAASLAPGAVPSMPPTPAAEVSNPARLVVLSTGLAGQEFDLIKPAMVIGRTDDNDIVVNHRSISRHHAKVVNENGRYHIVDLQSSNGVRVNGDEYSKVELRRADMIDLGHVRLRFVEAGEDFLFGRDAQAFIPPSSGGNRTILYAVIGVALIGAIAVFALTRGGDSSDKAATDTTEAPRSTDTGSTAPTTTTASNNTTSPTKTTQEDLEKIMPLLEVARGNVDNEQWAAAKSAASKALEIQPDSSEAKEIVAKAELEMENQEHYKAFEQAKATKDYAGIAQSFQAIDPDSMYKEKAREAHDKIRDDYVRKISVKAKELAKKRKCKDVDALVASAENTWPEAVEALADIECQEAVARTGSRRTSNGSSDKDTSGKDTTDAGATTVTSGGGDDDDDDDSSSKKPTKTYEQLMAEAKQAMLKNQYGRAQKLCDEALDLKPRDAGAATLCGLASCNMKKARQAKKYQAMLPPTRQTMIRQTCLKAGLTDF